MIKKVRIDKDNRLSELDWKGAEKVARKLLVYIESAPATERTEYRYDERVRPLIEDTIAHKLSWQAKCGVFPYYNREVVEGTGLDLVLSFAKTYSELVYILSRSLGSRSLSLHRTGEVNFEKDVWTNSLGIRYIDCWFED